MALAREFPALNPPSRRRPRRPGHGALTLSLGLLGTLVSPVAEANGRFPTSQYFLAGPGPAADTLALRTTFGMVVSVDAGHHWAWMCEDLFGYGTRPVDPAVALGARGPDGAPLLLGLPDGVARAMDTCRSSPVPELAGLYTGDMTSDPSGLGVYWVGIDGSLTSRVWASGDGARTFAPRGPGVTGVTFDTLEVAASDPQRMYLGGETAGAPRTTVLYRSDDGGRTLRALPADLLGGRDAWVSGVDPSHPDVVYVRSHIDPPDGGAPGTLLLRSDDGGEHFHQIARTVGDMKGFALSGDGRTVWAGGPDAADRLLQSDDGGPFHRVSSVQVLCLRWHAGALYVCANNQEDGFALGRSDDGGRSIVALLRFADLTGPALCPAGTVAHDLCALRWPQVQMLLGAAGASDAGSPTDAGAPADAGNGPMDSAMADVTAAPRPLVPAPGGCDAARGSQPAGTVGFVAALGMLAARRRRARRT